MKFGTTSLVRGLTALVMSSVLSGCGVFNITTSENEDQKRIRQSAPKYADFHQGSQPTRRSLRYDPSVESSLQEVQKLISEASIVYDSNKNHPSRVELERAFELGSKAYAQAEALMSKNNTNPGDVRYTQTFRELYNILGSVNEGLGRTREAEKCRDNEKSLTSLIELRTRKQFTGFVSNNELQGISNLNAMVATKYSLTNEPGFGVKVKEGEDVVEQVHNYDNKLAGRKAELALSSGSIFNGTNSLLSGRGVAYYTPVLVPGVVEHVRKLDKRQAEFEAKYQTNGVVCFGSIKPDFMVGDPISGRSYSVKVQ